MSKQASKQPSPTTPSSGGSSGSNADERHGDSFDPSGPYGGFGGAGGSQGDVYADAELRPPHASRQRQEHEAWEKDPSRDQHAGVQPGTKGPYGEYGEVQGHHGGYWYGGRDGGKQDQRAAPTKRK